MIGYQAGILAGIKYKRDWWLESKHGPEELQIRWAFMAPCAVHGGESTVQYGRWWVLDLSATPDAVVKTAYAAALMCEQHEAMEHFLYNGNRIFDPHRSIA